MNWFKRMKKGFKSRIKREISDNIWNKCTGCGHTSYKNTLERNHWICPQCGHYFSMGHEDYVELLVDGGSFVELDSGISASDPLGFKDDKRYIDRIRASKKASGMNEAVHTGTGRIGGHPVALGIMDTRFIMGSLGGATGEKIVRLIDRAMAERRTLILLSQSGGARMQESAYSLMQMAKISAKLHQLANAGLPYISILTDPTYGGVTASFGMLGDVIMAEPGARIGFAGQSVIKQFLNTEKLPSGFQVAETVLEHGFIDCIVGRKEMAATLARIIALLAPRGKASRPALAGRAAPTGS
jgi:acetyl-CoA carboxylase carboxyl transferase subunit beta